MSVLVSLTLQLFLLHLGSRRRYSVKIWLRIVLWLSYLIADSLATVALGAISNNLRNSCDGNDSQLQNELTAFWAPFLLLHLGGQDTITAYAVQDNELWLRHLLGLFVQTMVALYIFLLSCKANWLSFLTIPMLLAGFIKYTERILVMRSANCGLNTPTTPSCESIEEQALWYFKIFRYLFLNKKINNINRNLTDDQVLTTFASQTTWKVIEVELGYAYDVYYTKAFLFFTAWGFIFHFFSFTSILFVFVLFLLNEKHNHPKIDLIITYYWLELFLWRYMLFVHCVPPIGLGQQLM